MEYRQLGRSGVRVSKLCLGAMWYGDLTGPDESKQMINEALDAGINFVDTADVYARPGGSEIIVGEAIEENGRRDEIVLATKGMGPMGRDPNSLGASRYHLVRAVEDSLRRLRTDRIDLYYLHTLDLDTPLDEIMETLGVLVQQGKILYVGTSKWPPSLLVEAVKMSEACSGMPRIVVEQPAYNLTDRTAENELIWACLRHGVGIVPFGPLARGILSGAYRKGQPPPAGSWFHTMGQNDRGEFDRMERYTEASMDLVEKLIPLAEEKGVTLAEFALAWLMHRPGVTAPITGARTIEQLRSSLKACDVELTDEDHRRIDEIIAPGMAVTNYFHVHERFVKIVNDLAFKGTKQ